jgi:hypothetical protein
MVAHVREDPLAEFYTLDPRVVLVPVEHLTDGGCTPELAGFLERRAGWSSAALALFDAGFARYWTRSRDLARRTRTWPFPRRRHVAVVTQLDAVRPYAQLLNTSAWTVYAADVDPATSDAELLAFVLVLGDRMALTREVTTAAVQAAAWWLERTDDECAAFAAAAARSTRPDADAYVAVADALPWLRELGHEVLRPPDRVAGHRPIPATGLLVPTALEAAPPRLVAHWKRVATRVVARYHATWRRGDPALVENLCEWLTSDGPPLLVTADAGRIVWDPQAPDRLGAVRAALKGADAVAVERVHRDLERVSALTRRFLAVVADPQLLPPPAPNTLQSGYTYLHAVRRLIAYNLHEPGMERLRGPALPYEHAMVAARTAHEWGHLADAAGFVPRIVGADHWAALRAELAAALDDAVARAPAVVRSATAADLAALAEGRPLGVALGRLLVTRMPDYRANLVVRGLVTDVEAETYVRHNVRTLGAEYTGAQAWRLLLRYLFEYQYLAPALGLTRVADPRTFFVTSTGIAEELFATGVVDEARFDALAAIVGRLCASHAVDRTRLRFDSMPAAR